MSERNEDGERQKRAIDQGAAQFGAAAASNAARAADFIDEGWLAVEKVLQGETKKLNSTDARWAGAHRAQAKGNVFETLNDLKDNVERLEGGKDGQWRNTRVNGQNRAPQDSELVVDGKVVLARQDKLLSGPSTQNLKSVANEKYAGMDIAVPKGEVALWKAKMRELAEKTDDPQARAQYLDAEKRIRAGVGREEVDATVADPAAYRFRQEMKAWGKEAATAAGSAALGASVVAGTVSSIHNGFKLYRGDITGKEALVAVASDTSVSALRAGAVGALSVGVRYTASKIGLQALKKGGPAGAIAAATIEVGRSVYDLARGRITPGEAAEALGETGCCMAAGIYVGGAAATAFGNIGVIPLTVAGVSAPLSVPVILATTAACITVSLAYQTCVQIFKTAKLEQEEAERLMLLAAAAEAELIAQREVFEAAAEAYFQERQNAFGSAFAAVGLGMAAGDVASTISGLSRLAETVGGKLRFAGFEEFEQFMEDSETVLVL